MKVGYTLADLPALRPYPWQRLFPSDVAPEALALISRLLMFDPNKRITASETLHHSLFCDASAHAESLALEQACTDHPCACPSSFMLFPLPIYPLSALCPPPPPRQLLPTSPVPTPPTLPHVCPSPQWSRRPLPSLLRFLMTRSPNLRPISMRCSWSHLVCLTPLRAERAIRARCFPLTALPPGACRLPRLLLRRLKALRHACMLSCCERESKRQRAW